MPFGMVKFNLQGQIHDFRLKCFRTFEPHCLTSLWQVLILIFVLETPLGILKTYSWICAQGWLLVILRGANAKNWTRIEPCHVQGKHLQSFVTWVITTYICVLVVPDSKLLWENKDWVKVLTWYFGCQGRDRISWALLGQESELYPNKDPHVLGNFSKHNKVQLLYGLNLQKCLNIL